MAAIRAAGGMKGAKLRKVEKENEEENEKRKKGSGEEPEDLMSSLTKALEARRRGKLESRG